MVTPSARRCSLPDPPSASRPPPSLCPTLRCSQRSTTRCRSPYPLSGSHIDPPCLRCCLPGHSGPCDHAPPPSPSFPSRSSPVPSILRRAALPKRPCSGLPAMFFPSPPPADPCGCLLLHSHSCPRPWQPILPVRTKMSAIGRAGLLHVGWWRAGPCPVGKAPVGLA